MEEPIEIRTEAEAIAALAIRGAAQPVILLTADKREILVTPEGFKYSDISDPRATPDLPPKHIGQKVIIQTEDSLVDYVNRFKTEETVLFADVDQNAILAIIDYHGPGKPAHVDHTAKLVLPLSVEFQTWLAASGKLIGQLPFARFLEENAADIEAPAGADLLEACRDLQAIRRADFTKAVRTSSNNENFEWVEETELRGRQNGGVELPTKFKLNIPIYFGDPPTELFAFLRWELDDGKLHLGIQLHRAEHVRQAVFKQHVLNASDRTDRPAVFGRP